MKTKLNLRVLLFLLIPVFYFTLFTGFKEEKLDFSRLNILTGDLSPKDFINLIFTDTYFGRANPNDPRAIENNIKNFKDSLHFNSVHVYGYGSLGGGFDEPIDSYKVYVSGLMDTVRNSGLRGFYGRNKIEQLSYGQRLEYEAEGGNNGFSYTNNTGSVIPDSGRQVVKGCLNVIQCPETDVTPRYLCQNIYENLQHGDLIDFNQADLSEWHLKPVMRIPQNVFSISNTTPVIALVVTNYKGIVIDSIIVRVNNFRNENNNYFGQYISSYRFVDDRDSLEISGDTAIGGLNYGMRNDPWHKWDDSCKVDFKVWWFGEVDVWFDKMIVEDYWGNQLFHPNPDLREINETKITEEATEFTDNIADGSFFIDEVTHSQIPCIKRVYELMKQGNPNAKLNFASSNYHHLRGYKDNSIGQREILKLHTESFNVDAHEIQHVIPNILDSLDPKIPDTWKYSISDYTTYLQKRVFGDKSVETGITPEDGEDWGLNIPSKQGSLVYQIELARQQRDIFAPETKFIMQPQIHGVLRNDTTYYEGGIREPLNEEIEAQAMMSISHGAEGICWFVYYGKPTNFKSGGYYIFGLQNHDPLNNYPLRLINMYGQQKWNAVRNMNIKIEHWKPTLDKIDWNSGWSVHKDGANHEFISDIKSINVHSYPSSACDEDNINYDCPEKRYWEMGFFDPDFTNPEVSSIDKSKYFMMVNRRCVPDENNNGDLRQLEIKFNSSQLSGFRNWKIIDLDSNKVIRTFDKDSNIFVDMGIFQPGEGKLYKLAPVMQEGGTLITDESIDNINFNCNGDVNNSGKNISLYVGTTINFSDGVKWNISGGEFKTGLFPESPNELKVNMKSQNGVFWRGLNFIGCGEINIKNTIFENIQQSGPEEEYPSALSFLNCFNLNIYNCKFNFSNTNTIISIFINYAQSPGDSVFTSTILYNEFNNDSNQLSPLICLGYAESSIPLVINGNYFNAVNGNIAIFLSNVSAGVIKNNKILNYKTGVNILSSASYADLYNNDITGDSSITGAQISDGLMNLGLQGSVQTGGFNEIFSGGANANNLNSEYGYFTIDYGLNTFNIRDNLTSYHLGGIFPEESETEANGAENCFKLNNSITTPRENVVCPGPYYGSSCDVIFSFDPVVCAIEQNEDYLIVDLGNEVYDTIFITGGGSGAGFSNTGMSAGKTEITSVKELYNTICLEMRKRNYETVYTKCLQLISNYADSLQSLDALSKLYLSSLILDRSGDKMSDLKAFLESLILNHGGNEALVKKSFYLLQKTKVSLGLYQSAMSGFLQIMNQNPFSYEGLTASWDYAATSLLDSIHGSGGGMKGNNELQITDIGSDESEIYLSGENEYVFALFDDPVDTESKKNKNDDGKNNHLYTKEDKKMIKENILSSFQTSRDKKFEKIKTLQTKIADGKATGKEKSDFRSMKRLSETIRARKPQNIQEHLKNVGIDISKVFSYQGSFENDNNSDSRNDLIPGEYSLSQNYPNPFNPETRINFSLPVEGKVNLIIYDILGREVTRLLNNEFKTAGNYSVDFNGSGLPSGVYFYKIEAGDFRQVKRMVMVK